MLSRGGAGLARAGLGELAAGAVGAAEGATSSASSSGRPVGRVLFGVVSGQRRSLAGIMSPVAAAGGGRRVGGTLAALSARSASQRVRTVAPLVRGSSIGDATVRFEVRSLATSSTDADNADSNGKDSKKSKNDDDDDDNDTDDARSDRAESDSQAGSGGGVWSTFVSRLKEGVEDNKELKESLEKLRTRAKEVKQEVEEAEVVQKAAERAAESAERVKATWTAEQSERIKAAADEVRKKAGVVGEELSGRFKERAEAAAKVGEKVGASEAAKRAGSAASGVADASRSFVSRVVNSERGAAAIQRAKTLASYFVEDDHPLRLEAGSGKGPGGSGGSAGSGGSSGSGTAVTLREKSDWGKRWDEWTRESNIGERLGAIKKTLEESDNVLLRTGRAATSRVADISSRFVTETPMGVAVAAVRVSDPEFTIPGLCRLMERKLVPELVEAQMAWDLAELQARTGEAMMAGFQVWKEGVDEVGATARFRIMDIRNMEVVEGGMMDNTPHFRVRFEMHFIHSFTNAAGEVIEGEPDVVNQRIFDYTMRFDPSTPVKWRVAALEESQVF